MAMGNTATAFWVRTPGHGELREEPLAPPAEGQVRVRTLYTGVSRGTETLVFRGEVPEALHDSMRCPFQTGDFPAPVKYGYLNVGVVEEGVGERAQALVGRRVICLYPHQDHYIVPVEAVTPLPDALPSERAVLAPNMETALNGVWDGAPGPGDRVAVVGGGVVGLLTAWLTARIPGTEVLVVDVDPNRAREAEALGCDFATVAPTAFEADLVMHASGSPAGARTALELAGQEATIVELSWFGGRDVPLPLGGAFHPKRLRIRSSQVGGIPPERAPRWDYARRMRKALELASDAVLDVLISGESGFHDLPAVMSELASNGAGTLCHRIRYPGAAE